MHSPKLSKTLPTECLKSSIPHFSKLPLYRYFELMESKPSDFVLTEKYDGFYFGFGIDDEGFFSTPWKGKKVRSMSDYHAITEKHYRHVHFATELLVEALPNKIEKGRIYGTECVEDCNSNGETTNIVKYSMTDMNMPKYVSYEYTVLPLGTEKLFEEKEYFLVDSKFPKYETKFHSEGTLFLELQEGKTNVVTKIIDMPRMYEVSHEAAAEFFERLIDIVRENVIKACKAASQPVTLSGFRRAMSDENIAVEFEKAMKTVLKYDIKKKLYDHFKDARKNMFKTTSDFDEGFVLYDRRTGLRTKFVEPLFMETNRFMSTLTDGILTGKKGKNDLRDLMEVMFLEILIRNGYEHFELDEEAIEKFERESEENIRERVILDMTDKNNILNNIISFDQGVYSCSLPMPLSKKLRRIDEMFKKVMVVCRSASLVETWKVIRKSSSYK